MIDHLVLITLMLLGFFYWYHSQKIKEIAFKATQTYCQSVQVQMLDGYIAGNGVKLKRDKTGALCLQRTFAFEFSSTGERRYKGKTIMLGHQVKAIFMEPYRVDLS